MNTEYKKTVLGIIFLLSITIHTFGQGWNVDLVGSCYDLWDSIQSLEISGDHAFVAVGSGLRILDISDPINPFECGYCYSPPIDEEGYAKDVAVSDEYAFIAAGNGGIRVVDISDLTNPIEVASVPVDQAQEVDVQGNFLYVADNSYGMRIFDIADPLQPVEISFFDVHGQLRDLDIQGDFAYLPIWSEGLAVVDISDPYFPEEVGYIEFFYTAYTTEASYPYVYIGAVQYLYVIDVSNPQNPTIVYSFDTDYYFDNIAVSGDILAIACYLSDDPLPGKIRIYDVQNPGAPVFQGMFEMQDHFEAVDIYGDYVIGGNYHLGVRSIDISNPAVPIECGCYNPPGSTGRFKLIEDYAYLANYYGGVRIVDVSDPSYPVEIGGSDTYIYAIDLAVQGDSAYAISFSDNFKIFDISSAANPVLVQTFQLSIADVCDIEIEDDIICVGGGHCIVVLKYGESTGLEEVAFLSAQGHGNSLKIDGDVLYNVSSGCTYTGIFTIYDIANPEQPVIISNFSLRGGASQFCIDDNLVYILYSTYPSGEPGIQILDISNIYSPVEITYYETPLSNYCIAKSGNYLVTSNGPDGFKIFNVSNPLDMFEVGNYNTPVCALDVVIRDSLIYVSDMFHFEVFNCSEALSVNENNETGTLVSFELSVPYPNPFNSSTAISYQLLAVSHVNLTVYDIAGREIQSLVSGHQSSGEHTVVFDADGFTSGVYFARLTAGDFRQTRKMLLVK